jgi:hypothetical protein
LEWTRIRVGRKFRDFSSDHIANELLRTAVTQNAFPNKPLERILYLKNNQHITLLKVVENLMMLYVGMAVVYAGFYSDSFL